MVPAHLLERHVVWPYNDRTFLSPQVLITGFHTQAGAATANQNQYTEANKHSPTQCHWYFAATQALTIRMTGNCQSTGLEGHIQSILKCTGILLVIVCLLFLSQTHLTSALCVAGLSLINMAKPADVTHWIMVKGTRYHGCERERQQKVGLPVSSKVSFKKRKEKRIKNVLPSVPVSFAHCEKHWMAVW